MTAFLHRRTKSYIGSCHLVFFNLLILVDIFVAIVEYDHCLTVNAIVVGSIYAMSYIREESVGQSPKTFCLYLYLTILCEEVMKLKEITTFVLLSFKKIINIVCN